MCGAIENACAFSRPRSKCNSSVNIQRAQGIYGGLCSSAFELRIEPIVKVGFKEWRDRGGPSGRQDYVRSSDIGKDPLTDVFLGALETEFAPVGPDVFGERASGAGSPIVLTRESRGVAGLSYPEPSIILEERVDGTFAAL